MSLSLLAPPTRLPHADALELGEPVAWTHRAAVTRWTRARHGGPGGSWRLCEGFHRGEREPRISPTDPRDSDAMIDWLGAADDPWYVRPPVDGVNKTVLVWPTEGTGYLFGLVRRGIGSSYSATGTGSSSAWGVDEFEPGGFTAHAFVHLYAIKATLAGVGYLLAPHWAVSPRPSRLETLVGDVERECAKSHPSKQRLREALSRAGVKGW